MMRRRVSLHARQLLAVTLGLVAFLGLTGYALDRAFTETAERLSYERMRAHAFVYLGWSDISRSGIFLPPETPPDPRFNVPGSGLYAAVIGEAVQWQPPSSIGQNLPLDLSLPAPEERFEGPLQAGGSDNPGQRVYRYARGVIWEQDGQDGTELDFTFFVFEDARVVEAQVAVFRRALWGYLGAAVLLLLGVQIIVLQWSLLPLRRVERELARVQSGSRDELTEHHPRELTPLTDAINALVRSEREQMDRHRKTLADLAHSLKTPLAILRTRLGEGDDAKLRDEVGIQVQRMDDIVSYQLSRAAATGHKLFTVPLPIGPKAEEIVQSLEKLHVAKGAYCEFDIDESARFHGELGDLMELMGNLLENAFKWCAGRVLLTVRDLPDPEGRRSGLELIVEDDGQGIQPDKVESLLQRGVRGDERVQGHGIGLAIVQDIVKAYHGELLVERSAELGGARFHVVLPPGL